MANVAISISPPQLTESSSSAKDPTADMKTSLMLPGGDESSSGMRAWLGFLAGDSSAMRAAQAACSAGQSYLPMAYNSSSISSSCLSTGQFSSNGKSARTLSASFRQYNCGASSSYWASRRSMLDTCTNTCIPRILLDLKALTSGLGWKSGDLCAPLTCIRATHRGMQAGMDSCTELRID
eukprot:scaffold65546_cov49-Prasinocladus_malaysianus.AAC.2